MSCGRVDGWRQAASWCPDGWRKRLRLSRRGWSCVGWSCVGRSLVGMARPFDVVRRAAGWWGRGRGSGRAPPGEPALDGHEHGVDRDADEGDRDDARVHLRDLEVELGVRDVEPQPGLRAD